MITPPLYIFPFYHYNHIFSPHYFLEFSANCTKTTYHPPCLVSVNPNLASRSTETLMPMMPSPCGDTTCPRITDTRLHITPLIKSCRRALNVHEYMIHTLCFFIILRCNCYIFWLLSLKLIIISCCIMYMVVHFSLVDALF